MLLCNFPWLDIGDWDQLEEWLQARGIMLTETVFAVDVADAKLTAAHYAALNDGADGFEVGALCCSIFEGEPPSLAATPVCHFGPLRLGGSGSSMALMLELLVSRACRPSNGRHLPHLCTYITSSMGLSSNKG